MIKLTEQQINEIADFLDSSVKCFYNKSTGKIKAIPDFGSCYMADEEPWEKDLKELEANWEDYLEFDNMSSRESFEIMADFAENIENSILHNKLINALNKLKPFRNFKWQIDNSGEYVKFGSVLKEKGILSGLKNK